MTESPYDNGGVVPPGPTWVRNDSGEDIPVYTRDALAAKLKWIQDRLTRSPDKTTAPPWYQRAYTPDRGEIAKWLAATSDANRRWWVERTQEHMETAHDCFVQAHKQQIETLRAQLKKERERVAWLERNYGDPQ